MQSGIERTVLVALILVLSGCGLPGLYVQRSDMKTPRKTKDVQPVYPPSSLDAGDEGAVLVELKIGTSGAVADARVLWSRCPALNEAALTTARAWHFEPVTVNGQPVEFGMTARVAFRLPQKVKSRAGRPGACRWIDPPRPVL
jgi:TonB family protein